MVEVIKPKTKLKLQGAPECIMLGSHLHQMFILVALNLKKSISNDRD